MHMATPQISGAQKSPAQTGGAFIDKQARPILDQYPSQGTRRQLAGAEGVSSLAQD